MSTATTRTSSLRASFGSSITPPFGSQVSGFGSITIPNAANNETYQFVIPNPNLKPEVSVAFDGGFDWRVLGGAVLSTDAYEITTHNVFLTNSVAITPPAPFTANLGTLSNTVSSPLSKSSWASKRRSTTFTVGFGYWLAVRTALVLRPAAVVDLHGQVQREHIASARARHVEHRLEHHRHADLRYARFFQSVRLGILHPDQRRTVRVRDGLGRSEQHYGRLPHLRHVGQVPDRTREQGLRAVLRSESLLHQHRHQLGRTVQAQGFTESGHFYINPVSGRVHTATASRRSAQALPVPTFHFF